MTTIAAAELGKLMADYEASTGGRRDPRHEPRAGPLAGPAMSN
jgi:hypothetical protein